MKKLFVILAIFIAGCSGTPVPKPRGFFRIDFPEKKYVAYRDSSCPYRFEIPDYATVLPDTNRFAEPCWKYVIYASYHAQLYITYKTLHGDLAAFAEDSRDLVYKHTIKANAIDETVIHTPNKVYGVMYDIGGNAASNLQFYATDSTTHFIRGSLYFNTAPDADSLKPAVDFIKKDVIHLIQTLQWKK